MLVKSSYFTATYCFTSSFPVNFSYNSLLFTLTDFCCLLLVSLFSSQSNIAFLVRCFSFLKAHFCLIYLIMLFICHFSFFSPFFLISLHLPYFITPSFPVTILTYVLFLRTGSFCIRSSFSISCTVPLLICAGTVTQTLGTKTVCPQILRLCLQTAPPPSPSAIPSPAPHVLCPHLFASCKSILVDVSGRSVCDT